MRDGIEAAGRLLGEMQDLRGRIRAEAETVLAAWAPQIAGGDFGTSARNMAEYLALRHADLRPLQHPLAALGLSSLGRAEGHVGASLDAVVAALARIAGAPAAFPDPAAFAAGARLLEARRDALFGDRPGQGTRIMATLPSEAAEDAGLALRLAEAGVDAVRINCAHDSPAVWARMLEQCRNAGATVGRRIAVAMDLAGPKVRTVTVARAEHLRLRRGDRLVLANAIDPGEPLPQATLSHPELLDLLDGGSAVWIDDGRLRTRVVQAAPGRAVLEVTGARDKGEKLKPEKGVNLPGTDVLIPALTPEDRADLEFVAAHADIVGYSFVQTPEDVAELLAALDARCGTGPRPAVMLKVETRLAVANLPQLILAAGGAGPVAVMIARGDLAVEIGFERLSEIQDEILWLAEAAQVPVVWATQVLDGMIHDGIASRAETSDAALGQRAECVMLNKGPFLPQAVGFLKDVLTRMDRHQAKKFANLGPLHAWRMP